MIKIPDLINTVCVGENGNIKHFSEEDVNRVLSSLSTREIRYPITDNRVTENKNKAEELRSKGWIRLEGALSHKLDVIDSISEQLNRLLDGKELDFNSSLGRQVGEDGIKLNQSEARHEKLFISIPQPLYNVPEIAEIIFDESLVNLAKSFFESMPAIGNLNLRKSFVNNLANESTTMYHVDPNSPYFLKAFVYLKNVDSVEDGPFTYVEGSVDNKPNNLLEKYRWSDEEIESFYGREKIKHLTAKRGDIVFAMTTGFHKGQKCTRKERELLTIDYTCHPDSWDMRKQLSIKKETFLNLPLDKIPLTDFLHIKE
jgi:hypothetical protein